MLMQVFQFECKSDTTLTRNGDVCAQIGTFRDIRFVLFSCWVRGDGYLTFSVWWRRLKDQEYFFISLSCQTNRHELICADHCYQIGWCSGEKFTITARRQSGCAKLTAALCTAGSSSAHKYFHNLTTSCSGSSSHLCL